MYQLVSPYGHTIFESGKLKHSDLCSTPRQSIIVEQGVVIKRAAGVDVIKLVSFDADDEAK
jgi:hypothetical protein